MHFGKTGGYLLAAVEVFVNIAGKDRIYRSGRNHREVRAGGPYDAHALIRIAPQICFIDVERDFLVRADVVDEVAESRTEIQGNPVRVYIALQVVADRAAKMHVGR